MRDENVMADRGAWGNLRQSPVNIPRPSLVENILSLLMMTNHMGTGRRLNDHVCLPRSISGVKMRVFNIKRRM